MTLLKPYSYGKYNKHDKKEQWIRLTEGCPNQCEYCYEPKEYKIFTIPKIIRNVVKIMDMNLLCKIESRNIIRDLGSKKVNGKNVYYELLCGIDYRFLTEDLASDLKLNRFGLFNRKNKFNYGMRIAWDHKFKEQDKIRKAIKMLIKAGYNTKNINVFMVCNWKITYEECVKKLDLCKYWSVKVSDCYYDNQLSPNFIPIHWTLEQMKNFRKQVRRHNQIINFGIDIEQHKKDQKL